VNTGRPVAGGVKPLALQAECGFHAYGEMRLKAPALETPAPGIDARERGMLLHKALELVWLKLGSHFEISVTETQILRPTIADSVAAAELYVFRGHVPAELRQAVEREKHRLEILIEKLLDVERTRAPFTIETLEARLFTESEIPWDSLAFKTVKVTLEHFFADRRLGQFTVHCADIA